MTNALSDVANKLHIDLCGECAHDTTFELKIEAALKSYANKTLMNVLGKLPLQDMKQKYTWIGARDIIQQEMESL